jgi:hypothetical protein
MAEDGLVYKIVYGFVYMGVFLLFVVSYFYLKFHGVHLFCRNPKQWV